MLEKLIISKVKSVWSLILCISDFSISKEEDSINNLSAIFPFFTDIKSLNGKSPQLFSTIKISKSLYLPKDIPLTD